MRENDLFLYSNSCVTIATLWFPTILPIGWSGSWVDVEADLNVLEKVEVEWRWSLPCVPATVQQRLFSSRILLSSSMVLRA